MLIDPKFLFTLAFFFFRRANREAKFSRSSFEIQMREPMTRFPKFIFLRGRSIHLAAVHVYAYRNEEPPWGLSSFILRRINRAGRAWRPVSPSRASFRGLAERSRDLEREGILLIRLNANWQLAGRRKSAGNALEASAESRSRILRSIQEWPGEATQRSDRKSNEGKWKTIARRDFSKRREIAGYGPVVNDPSLRRLASILPAQLIALAAFRGRISSDTHEDAATDIVFRWIIEVVQVRNRALESFGLVDTSRPSRMRP